MLVKYKKAGMPDHIIAAKLGISVNEVWRRWEELKVLAQQVDCGYGDLTMQFNVLCHQYQLLGESLKILGDALGSRASGEEVQAALAAVKPEDHVKQLFTHFIILRPFQPVDPVKALEESTKRIQQGN